MVAPALGPVCVPDSSVEGDGGASGSSYGFATRVVWGKCLASRLDIAMHHESEL